MAPPPSTAPESPAALLDGCVLVPLARSPRMRALAAEGARLARQCGVQPLFLHVGAADAAARTDLETTIAAVGGGELLVAPGRRPDQVICRIARERNAGLVVAGALERESALTEVMGSVARRVARSAPCPVLLLASPRVEPRPWRRPQVNIEDFERSRALIDFACALAEREGAEDLQVVYEYEAHGAHLAAMADTGEDAAVQTQALQGEQEIALGDFLASWTDRALELRRVCLPGRQGYEATALAETDDRDLLICHAPKSGLWAWLLRSDAEVALKRLPCALLLYRPSRQRRRASTPAPKS